MVTESRPTLFDIKHLVEVAEVQLEVRHALAATAPVGERSLVTKFSPVIVRLIPTDVGRFRIDARETTGASKVNPAGDVPMWYPTVRKSPREPKPAYCWHATTELLVQVVVMHAESPMYPVGVKDCMPKFNPEIVTLSPPVVAVLTKFEMEIVGGSNVKKTARVPITVFTVA